MGIGIVTEVVATMNVRRMIVDTRRGQSKPLSIGAYISISDILQVIIVVLHGAPIVNGLGHPQDVVIDFLYELGRGGIFVYISHSSPVGPGSDSWVNSARGLINLLSYMTTKSSAAPA